MCGNNATALQELAYHSGPGLVGATTRHLLRRKRHKVSRTGSPRPLSGGAKRTSVSDDAYDRGPMESVALDIGCLPSLAFIRVPAAGSRNECGIALSQFVITQPDLLLGRVLCRGLLDHGRDNGIVGRDPTRHDVPFFAVPGLDTPRPRALVVGAGHLDRLQLVLESKLLEAFRREVEVFKAPPDLLAG